MNKRLTMTGGRRALAAATLVAALLGSLFVTAAPAGAATGTIVFVKDHNVWIMPADDPSAARPVTTDGTADAPYVAPTADDRGAILAVRGGPRGEIVRMDQNGTLLGAPFRPALAGNIDDMDLAPGGVVFSYTHYESYSSPEGFIVAPTLDFAYADGSDSSAVANPMFDDYYATFYSDTQAALPGEIEESGDSSFPTVATYTLGDADKQTWFRLCDTSQDFEDWCYPLYADVTDARHRLVVSLQGSTWVPVGPRLRVFTMSAPAPAEPTQSCELVGPEPGILDDFGFWNPSWSPDGSALVYELNAAFEDSPQPAGAGIYLASGFDADCAQAFAGTQLVVPGGSQPDWSAAPLGATPPGTEPPPTDEPTEPPPTEPPPTEPPPTDEPTAPPVTAGGGFDGDPASTERIDHADPTAAAVAISRSRFADGQADHVVLSRDDTFPDSLAGAPLTAGGPLLLTASATLSDATAAELDRVLPDGGVVYLLGGVAAIGQGVQDTLAARGYDVRRLAGPSRVETAVAVADQVRALNPGVGEAGLARAYGAPGNETSGWADSVTGGGWAASRGVPILVTPTEGLHPAVDAWLRADTPSQTVLFGGTAALSDTVAASVPNPRRVAGPERTATAAEIATQLWGASPSGAREFVIINGEHPAGWAFGLAAGGLAADEGAPILMVTTRVPDPTASLVSACGTPQVDLLVIGDASVVSEQLRQQLDDLDGQAC